MSLARSTLAAVVLAAALAPLAAGCIYAPIDLGGLADLGRVQEVTLVDAPVDHKVVLIAIDGEITDEADAGFFGTTEGTTAQVKDVLDLARRDSDVKAIILRINSPGGGVTASDVVHREIVKWKRETRKPVVALLMDVAASGGYYIAVAADRIVAHPTSTTGSIGVIALLPNVSGLADKIGVKVHAVKSGDRKDMGNPFRPITDDDLKTFQSLIDQSYNRFLDVILEGRKGLGREALRKVADGRVMTAADARAAKLVDEIGYFDEALLAARRLANIPDARVVTFERKGLGAGKRTIYSRSFADPIEATILGRGREGDRNLVKIDARPLLPSPRPAIKYLWLPMMN